MSAFNLAFAVNLILGAALRAAGDAWSPLWIGVAVNLLNVPLLYVLVFGHHGFPQMGVAGAALAGGTSFSVGAAALLAIWLRQGFPLEACAQQVVPARAVRAAAAHRSPRGLEMVVFQLGYFGFLMLIRPLLRHRGRSPPTASARVC